MNPQTYHDSNDLVSTSWVDQMRNSLTKPEELFRAGLITHEQVASASALALRYRVRITPYYQSLLEWRLDPSGKLLPSPDCPIALQAIPNLLESDPTHLPATIESLSKEIYGRPVPWSPDPIGDLTWLEEERITHRYAGRALLHLTSTCSVYCRFCFRKSQLNDPERALYEGDLKNTLTYLKAHPEIQEVILTGGDPLTLSDRTLKKILEDLVGLPWIKTVRIHTRATVTLPMRVDDGLLKTLSTITDSNHSQLVIVNHFNHPRELTPASRLALRKLSRQGITLFNQNVLLKGINTSVETLATLYQGLYEIGVLPIYLHHPDWTTNSFGFRIPLEVARDLYLKLAGRVTGPALPKYVLDLPGGQGKMQVLAAKMTAQLREDHLENRKMVASTWEFPLPEIKTSTAQLKERRDKITYLDCAWES
jgi:lysine 2,3-aminomutase